MSVPDDHREQVLRFLAGAGSPLDSGVSAIAGFVLVIELSTPSGERGIVKISSDAGGYPLPWYAAGGLLNGAIGMPDFDESV
jgi:hypothetical protein